MLHMLPIESSQSERRMWTATNTTFVRRANLQCKSLRTFTANRNLSYGVCNYALVKKSQIIIEQYKLKMWSARQCAVIWVNSIEDKRSHRLTGIHRTFQNYSFFNLALWGKMLSVTNKVNLLLLVWFSLILQRSDLLIYKNMVTFTSTTASTSTCLHVFNTAYP